MQKFVLFFLAVGMLFISCSKDEFPSSKVEIETSTETGWLVPLNDLILSELPPDPIPSIDAPYFQSIQTLSLNPDETVYIYRYGDIIRAYSQSVLEEHEIVNDQIGEHYFAVTLCPRTGSALVWNREINGQVSEFGVSGHLYNENLIPYDRNSQSYWSQMGLKSIKGALAGAELNNEFLLLTSVNTLLQNFPNASILVDTAGSQCDSACVGPVKKKNVLVKNTKADSNGNDYFGIVNISQGHTSEVLLFNYSNFSDSISIFNPKFGNMKLIVLGSKTLQFMVAFKNNSGNSQVRFFPIQDSLPIVFGDNMGNRYDLTGYVVSGPSAGLRLPSPLSYTAHNFAWELFYTEGLNYYD